MTSCNGMPDRSEGLAAEKRQAPAGRNLQRLMLRSRANALVSVRRVTEVNAGRKTPGVDGKVALMASQKADLADWCQRRSRLWTARPVRRVLIPKPGSAKKRALGIPTEPANRPVAQGS